MNLTIGAGIFVLPAIVAQNLGPAAFTAYLLCALLVIFFIAVFSLLSFINVRGVKSGSYFAAAATLVKLMPLILLILIGLFSISTVNLSVKTWPPLKNIGETALVLFFAFMGIETALNVSGKIKHLVVKYSFRNGYVCIYIFKVSPIIRCTTQIKAN